MYPDDVAVVHQSGHDVSEPAVDDVERVPPLVKAALVPVAPGLVDAAGGGAGGFGDGRA